MNQIKTIFVFLFFLTLSFYILVKPTVADMMPLFDSDKNCKWYENTVICRQYKSIDDCSKYSNSPDYYFADKEHSFFNTLKYCQKLSFRTLPVKVLNFLLVFIFDYVINIIILVFGFYLIGKKDKILKLKFLVYTLAVTIGGGIIDTIYVLGASESGFYSGYYKSFEITLNSQLFIGSVMLTSILLMLFNVILAKRIYFLNIRQSFIVSLLIGFLTNPFIFILIKSMTSFYSSLDFVKFPTIIYDLFQWTN